MPFEAGLAVAFGHGTHHQWRVFEEKRYRLIQSLSDLNGYELFIHRGTAKGILQAIVDAFLDLPANEDHIRRLFRVLVRYREQQMGRELFGPRPFRTLVRVAIESPKKLLGMD